MNNTAEIIKFSTAQVLQDYQEPAKVASLDDGYTRIANELLEAAMSHPMTKRQLRVLLAIMRKTYGFNKKEDRISGSQLAELTKLTRQHCSSAVNELIQLNIIYRKGGSSSPIGINKNLESWGGESKPVPIKQNRVSEPVLESVSESKIESNSDSKLGHTKDNIKDNIKDNKHIRVSPDEIKDLFNDKKTGLTKVLKLNPNRKTLIKARCKDLPTLQDWSNFFDQIAASDFLTGKNSDWQASFDWVLKDSNCLKILEGNYDNKPKFTQVPSQAPSNISNDFKTEWE